ncbi:uncharacterized protein LOC119402205 isoform X2 [Rhipicephalus sanguineus]|uniref:uncharacterized protein LOC119402205 isoform X2 n=1 Tax=Rhipicephalus sanguineus TaxID=34632 RepID=UPI0020C4862F|nr:uncharacterized protein LOC119402205 isoform X2 [Rhipicephalus sanguineus]
MRESPGTSGRSQTAEARYVDRREDHGHNQGTWPAGVPELRTPTGASSGAHGVQHCPSCPLRRCGICSTSQTHCESSCSQRWHRRVTAALCVVGVTLSFVILALGLLFGGGLRRGSRSAWANLNGEAAVSNASTPAPSLKPEVALPQGPLKLDAVYIMRLWPT